MDKSAVRYFSSPTGSRDHAVESEQRRAVSICGIDTAQYEEPPKLMLEPKRKLCSNCERILKNSPKSVLHPGQVNSYRIDESQRQKILMALGHLAVERPGWDMALGDIALVFGGTDLYEEFKRFVSHGEVGRVIDEDVL